MAVGSGTCEFHCEREAEGLLLGLHWRKQQSVHWSFDRSAMAAFFFEKLRVAPDVWLCSDGMRANGAHRWAQRNGASSPYGIGLDCKNAASL